MPGEADAADATEVAPRPPGAYDGVTDGTSNHYGDIGSPGDRIAVHEDGESVGGSGWDVERVGEGGDDWHAAVDGEVEHGGDCARGLELRAGSWRANICPPLQKVRSHRVDECNLHFPFFVDAAISCVQVLKPHQLDGVRWLFKCAAGGGGLLTDEPGLGKTLQVITTIEALVRSHLVWRVLAVCPANLCALRLLTLGWASRRPRQRAAAPPPPRPRRRLAAMRMRHCAAWASSAVAAAGMAAPTATRASSYSCASRPSCWCWPSSRGSSPHPRSGSSRRRREERVAAAGRRRRPGARVVCVSVGASCA